MTIPMPEPSGWIMSGEPDGVFRYQRGPLTQMQSLMYSTAPVWEERDIQKYVEAYAAAKVREALEAAANEPQAHIRQLEREGWVEEWPDELDLLHTFGGSISKRIRGLIPTGTKEKK